MGRINGFLFGSLVPAIEVLLVLAGLALLGWEGLLYGRTGIWTTIRVEALYHPAHVSALVGWLLGLPLSGVCMGTGVGMFFILPPAYSYA